jgi:MFS superfamily sulfate permease-like transporter
MQSTITIHLPSRASFLKDMLASIVVFLVALPLCMGIAIASGMPPATGIITGIIGGLVVSTIGGCELQISGPAAGLAVVTYEILQQPGGPEKLGIIFVLAGIVQLLAGALGLAQLFRAVPPSVVHGMLSGIGVLIFAGQFHVMVDDLPKSTGLANLASIPQSIYKVVSASGGHVHEEAAILGIATISILLLWTKFAPRRFRAVPGALVAIVLTTIAATILNAPVRHIELPPTLSDALHVIVPGALAHLKERDLWLDGLAVAFIASAETLLTAAALDKMHTGPRTKFDRELAAQGIGNMLCGLVGVLPMTGVMVRSGANVSAGAKTRLAGVMHGLWLLLFVCLVPGMVKMIPTSTLAALLVYTGYKLANPTVFKELRRFGRTEVIIYAVTLVSVVAIDLLTGILVGILATIIKLLFIFSRLDIEVDEHPESNSTDIWLKGVATFLNLPRFVSVLETMRPGSEVNIHLKGLDYLDHACLDMLMSWDTQHQSTGGSVNMDWSALGSVFLSRRQRMEGKATQEFRLILAQKNESTKSEKEADEGNSGQQAH